MTLFVLEHPSHGQVPDSRYADDAASDDDCIDVQDDDVSGGMTLPDDDASYGGREPGCND